MVHAAESVVGANSTLGLSPSAVSAGAGDAVLAMPGSALTLGLSPVGMLDRKSHGLGLSHTEHLDGTRLDAISGIFALDSFTRLGALVMRYGADGIPYIKEGEPLPVDDEWNTLSIADYVLSIAVARKLPLKLEAALALHFLYRELDQVGAGFRGDAMLRFRPVDRWFLGAKLEGWTSSRTYWASGYEEYSPAELYWATGYRQSVPYLYGEVSLGYQSPGTISPGNRSFSVADSWLSDTSLTSKSDLGGGRPWEAPLTWLGEGSLGAELRFDWGGAVRLGLQSAKDFDSWSVGGGFKVLRWISIDYSFARQPRFSGIHRVSMEFEPWANKKLPPPPSATTPPPPQPVEPVPAPEIAEEPAGKTWEE
jgi:hypothetical protein